VCTMIIIITAALVGPRKKKQVHPMWPT
jgi:hypothetical protein